MCDPHYVDHIITRIYMHGVQFFIHAVSERGDVAKHTHCDIAIDKNYSKLEFILVF